MRAMLDKVEARGVVDTARRICKTCELVLMCRGDLYDVCFRMCYVRFHTVLLIDHDKLALSGVNHIVKFQAAAGGVQRATLPTDAPAKAGAAITENGETADFGDAVQAGSIAAVQAGQ